MFKIARTVKQIFNTARNVQKAASVSINSGLKYCSQSKGYIEDAGEEFTFLKALPSQSGKTSIQDKFNPNIQNIAKTKTTPLLDSAAIRKLIYARFADDIVASSKNTADIDTKSNDTREYIGDAVTTYNITDEFKELKSQGYDFAVAKKALQNQNVKSLVERMKGLAVAGYMSSYSGELGLKEEVEVLMHKKELVINEFMETVTSSIEGAVEYSSELLG